MITQTRGVKRNFFLMRLLFGDAGESSFRSQAYLGYFGGDKRSQARLGESSLSRKAFQFPVFIRSVLVIVNFA